MDEERETTPYEPETIFSFRDLDDETIQILIDDKIATGG